MWLYLEMEAFKEWLRENEVIGMGPNLIGHREEITVYTPKGEASGETSLAHTLIDQAASMK